MARSSMNSLDIMFTVRELSKLLGEGFIDNIYIIEGSLILIRVRVAGDRYDILVDPPRRIHLTEFDYEKPRIPPNKCITLRRHIVGGRIRDISQHRFERIVVFSIATRRGDYKLYVELFREGNLILVDPYGRIISTLHSRRMRDRVVAPGVEFKLPPALGLDPFSDSLDSIVEKLPSDDTSIARWMTLALGIPSPYLDEVLARMGLNKDAIVRDLPKSVPLAIVETLRGMVSSIEGPPFRSYVYLSDEGVPVDFSPFKLSIYNLRCEEYPSFNSALDSYFHRLMLSEEYDRVAIARRKQATEIAKSIGRIEARISKLESEALDYKRIADTLSMHMDRLGMIASLILESKRLGMDDEEILREASNLARNLNLKLLDIDFRSGLFTVKLNGYDVKLSFIEDVYGSISRYYSMYKRKYGEVESLRFKLEELRRNLSELESKIVEYPLTQKVKVRRKWYEKFNFFISSEGFLVLAGRDASTNEILIKRYTSPEDIVFHADIHGAPFVVVKTEGRMPSEATIMEAAIFAASYSQAWRDGFSSLDVFYVSPSQLSKSPPPGHYIPRGAFRIIGSKNYVRSVPLELAVGLALSETGFEVMVAPVSAVKARTSVYVRIVPGVIAKDKLVELIKARLIDKARKVFERGLPTNIFDDLHLKLPAGGGRIIDE